MDIGVDGTVLENPNSVAIETANFLSRRIRYSIFLAIPYAQAVVDMASSRTFGCRKRNGIISDSLSMSFIRSHKNK